MVTHGLAHAQPGHHAGQKETGLIDQRDGLGGCGSGETSRPARIKAGNAGRFERSGTSAMTSARGTVKRLLAHMAMQSCIAICRCSQSSQGGVSPLLSDTTAAVATCMAMGIITLAFSGAARNARMAISPT